MKVFYLVFRQDTWDGGNKRLIANKKSGRVAERIRTKVQKQMDSIAYIEIWTQPTLPFEGAENEQQQEADSRAEG